MDGHPKFSLAYLTVIGTPPLRMVDMAARAGYDYVSVRFNAVTDDEVPFPFLTDPTLVRDFNKRLEATGLAVLDAELIRIGPDDRPAEYRAFIEVAAEVGAKHLIVQLPDPNRDRAAENLFKICEMAAPFGMTADLEFIPWTPVCDLAAAAEIVHKADHPGSGILIDTLHFDRSDSSVPQLRVIPPDMFRLIQLCDAPREAPHSDDGLISAARTARSMPGQGGIDLRPLVEALPMVPYSLEVPNEVMRRDIGTQEFVRRLLDTSREFLAASDRRVSVLN